MKYFEDLKIIDAEKFKKNMENLKGRMDSNELENFSIFLTLMWKMLSSFSENNAHFFKKMRPHFIQAKWKLAVLKGTVTFLSLLNNFQENLIQASLHKRIDFQQIIRINQTYHNFLKNFKKEKTDVRLDIQNIDRLIKKISEEIEFHYDINVDTHL